MKYNYHFLFFLSILTSVCRSQDKAVAFNDPHIHYMGRVIMRDNAAELSWTATTVSIHFNGTGVKVLLKDERGDNYYNVLIDDKLTMILHPDSLKGMYTLASGLPSGKHSLEFFKRTEWAMGKTWLYSFLPDAQTTLLPAPSSKKRKIEFFGNSITCGYAVEDSSGKDRGTAPYENAYVAYAAITARHFNAEFNCVTKSGIGVMVSWFPLIMPEMWDRADATDPDSKWDFSRFDPDVVVINLFQNDAWIVNIPDNVQFKARFGKSAPGADTIIAAYKNFVEQVRVKHPHAYIICMLGNMDASKEGAPWPGYIQKVVSLLDDKKIFSFIVPFKGTAGHPNGLEQQVLAEGLIRFIGEHIKW